MPLRYVRTYSVTFRVTVAALLALGAAGFVLGGRPVPHLTFFLPWYFLTTAGIEIATAVLLALIIRSSHRRALVPLCVLFILRGALDVAVVMTITLPGSDSPLIMPGNSAPAWLFVALRLVLPAGAVWYAWARRADKRFTPAAMRRFMLRELPLWLAGSVAATALLLVAQRGVVPLFPLGSYASAALVSISEVLAVITAGALAAEYWIGTRPRDIIDESIALALIASLLGLLASPFHQVRFGAAWTATEALYLIAATFVLIGMLVYLVQRLGLALRIESESLRARAVTLERNVEVETSIVKSRFVATVSHELRTPLSGIVGTAELLERTPLSAAQSKLIAAIRGSADDLSRIVDDLLNFSRAEAGRIDLEETSFSIEQVTDAVVALFAAPARTKGIALKRRIDPSLPPAMLGDDGRLRQVLQNLVDNAVRFTASGFVRIDVSPERKAGVLRAVRFAVEDTGIGIAARAHQQIFEPFVQQDSSTARRYGGAGLGLSIARHLVELMGGRLTVQSAPGEGSTFSFAVPYRAPNPGDAPPAAGDSDAIDGILQRDARVERILVAEDSPVNQELLLAQLEHLGFMADAVTDGKAAVAAATTGRYDLIFMDCQMPDIDGFEAARLIRNSGMPGATVPIVAITANVLPGYRESCLEAGMNDYLAKPALIRPLARIIDRWLPARAAPAAGVRES